MPEPPPERPSSTPGAFRQPRPRGRPVSWVRVGLVLVGLGLLVPLALAPFVDRWGDGETTYADVVKRWSYQPGPARKAECDRVVEEARRAGRSPPEVPEAAGCYARVPDIWVSYWPATTASLALALVGLVVAGVARRRGRIRPPGEAPGP